MRHWVTLTAAVALVAATAACSHRNETSTSTAPAYSGSTSTAPAYSGSNSTMTAPGQDLRHGGSSTQGLGVAPPGGDTSSTSGGGAGGASGGAGGSGGAAGAGGGSGH